MVRAIQGNHKNLLQMAFLELKNKRNLNLPNSSEKKVDNFPDDVTEKQNGLISLLKD